MLTNLSPHSTQTNHQLRTSTQTQNTVTIVAKTAIPPTSGKGNASGTKHTQKLRSPAQEMVANTKTLTSEDENHWRRRSCGGRTTGNGSSCETISKSREEGGRDRFEKEKGRKAETRGSPGSGRGAMEGYSERGVMRGRCFGESGGGQWVAWFGAPSAIPACTLSDPRPRPRVALLSPAPPFFPRLFLFLRSLFLFCRTFFGGPSASPLVAGASFRCSPVQFHRETRPFPCLRASLQSLLNPCELDSV